MEQDVIECDVITSFMFVVKGKVMRGLISIDINFKGHHLDNGTYLLWRP